MAHSSTDHTRDGRRRSNRLLRIEPPSQDLEQTLKRRKRPHHLTTSINEADSANRFISRLACPQVRTPVSLLSARINCAGTQEALRHKLGSYSNLAQAVQVSAEAAIAWIDSLSEPDSKMEAPENSKLTTMQQQQQEPLEGLAESLRLMADDPAPDYNLHLLADVASSRPYLECRRSEGSTKTDEGSSGNSTSSTEDTSSTDDSSSSETSTASETEGMMTDEMVAPSDVGPASDALPVANGQEEGGVETAVQQLQPIGHYQIVYLVQPVPLFLGHV